MIAECVTVDNKICIFPFNYQNQTYDGCTGEGEPDGRPWCSTKVTSEGDHIGDQGEWGHCAADSPSNGTFLPLASDRMCGLQENQMASFIINGENSERGQFPFMALLGRKAQKRGRNGKQEIIMQWVCGGTLINHWYVLTAAHCQDSIAMVRLGDWDIFTTDCNGDICLPPHQDFEIKKEYFIPHASFIPATATHQNVLNDMALIRLPRDAILNAGVQFGCLPLTPPDQDLAAEGEEGRIIGWGHTKANDALFRSGGDLRTYHIPTVIQQTATILIVGQETHGN